MDVYLYYNTKRLNSTALPPQETDVLECYFKNDCSLLTPVLKISAATLPDINYFWLKGRYYWITDIISLADGLWEIHGQVDVLATYRGHIFNTSAFVLYDSTSNTQIPDNRLAVETDVNTNTSTAAMPWSFASGDGTYLIATTGAKDSFSWNDGNYYSQSDTRAGTGVYTIPYSSLQQLGFDVADLTSDLQTFYTSYINDMSHDSNIIVAQHSDFFEAIYNAIYGGALILGDTLKYTLRFWKIIAENLIGGGNALSNIKAAYWLPFVVPDTATSAVSKPLALGTYKDNVSGLRRVDDAIITSLWQDVSIPWQFSDWRNASCSEVMLYIPMIGCINIPTDVVKGHSTLQVRIGLNIYSGSMSCEVRCDGGSLGTYGANVGMPYLIGDSNVNLASITNTITNAASQNYVGAALSGISSLNAMSTSVGGVGGGAGSALTNVITCIVRYHNTSQSPSALLSTIGTPTHQLKTLYSGQGYVQCLNAQVNGASVDGEPYASQTELQQINEYLNTGVYLE